MGTSSYIILNTGSDLRGLAAGSVCVCVHEHSDLTLAMFADHPLLAKQQHVLPSLIGALAVSQ